MKTGNILQNGMFFKQAKLTREDKTTDKKEPNKAAGDRVDLSIKGTPVIPASIASNEEALEILYGMDFRQAKDIDWISKDGTARLMTLLQS